MKNRKTLTLVALSFLSAQQALAAPFQANSIVVSRYGSDAADCTDNRGCPVALEEYDLTTAQLRQRIDLPSLQNGSNRPFTLEEFSGGHLSPSQDGRFLTMLGYGRAVDPLATSDLSSTAASVVPRVVARIDSNGVVDTSTSLGPSAFSVVSPRSVATLDGSSYWAVAENGGVRYATHGASDSTAISGNFASGEYILAADNTLFFSIPNIFLQSLRIATLPASNALSQTAVALPASSSGSILVAGFTLLDVSPGIPGADLMYLARSGSSVLKFRKTADGRWNPLGSTADFNAYSVAARIKPGTSNVVQIYATGDCSTTSVRFAVCLIEDAAGFDSPMNTTVGVFIPARPRGGFLSVAMPPLGTSPSAAGKVISGNLAGGWFDPARSGEGFFIDVSNVGTRKVLFASWFTYLSGQQQYLVGSVDVPPGATGVDVPLFSTKGTGFGSQFVASQVQITPWGSIRLDFASCNQMRVTYNGGGQTGTLVQQRAVGALSDVGCN